MTPEQEWRQFLLEEIKALRQDVSDVKSEMGTLKVKVAIFSSLAGSIATFIANKLF